MDNQTPQQTEMDQNTLMGILAYIGPLVIVSYVVANKNPFVKFHVKQGLTLLVIEVIVWFVSIIFWPLWVILELINLALLVLSIVGIINVVQKQEKELPVIGHFAKSFKI